MVSLPMTTPYREGILRWEDTRILSLTWELLEFDDYPHTTSPTSQSLVFTSLTEIFWQHAFTSPV